MQWLGASVGIVERAAHRLGAAAPAKRQADADGGQGTPSQLRPDLIERVAQTASRTPTASVVAESTLPDASIAVPPPSAFEPRRTSTPLRIPSKIEFDFAVLRDRNFITPPGERTHIAEEFRRIKRHVLANVLTTKRGTPVNSVMVSSALPGEGKTFCSINLAMSLAMELDRSVILVDADTIKPNVLNSLGVKTTLRGMMDLLADPSLCVADVICDTNVPNLRIIPAGMLHPQSTELLASDAMNRLVSELSSAYKDRIVIFDSPPLLVASEAIALATHMSQVLMVVAAGESSEAALKEALHRLEGCEGSVGMVLNKKPNPGSGYGYYGYGYGRGYGAGHGR